MAYNVKGKIFTDNSLMDEIVFNCKKILSEIVIKNDVLANNSETENSLMNAEVYQIQSEDGIVPFSVFPFTREIYEAFGYDSQTIMACLRDRENVPQEDRDSLTLFANEYFKDNFEEENDYYRMLNGLPPFNSGEEYFIYITQDDIPKKYNKNVDTRIPLHEQPLEIISILYNTGQMDKIRQKYPISKYSYINFLGTRKIDLYKARKASKWDILYMPNVYYLVEDKFTEFYMINREIYLNQTYQEAYSDTSDYYDQLMIVNLLAQTFADMITDVPEWYIRRDIFDIRSVKYFLESYGVKFFKEIPIKYQIAIVKNTNKLIKFKSSTMNLEDIAHIFVEDNIRIIKYWLYKKRLMQKDKHYTRGDVNDEYSLEFISSGIDESYDDYIKDSIYRTPYDDITYADKYWDGKDTHKYIKDRTIEQDFTINGTKYMAVEYAISMREYNFQVSYFLGLILDSKVDTSDIMIPVPTIDENCEFAISNLLIFVMLLSDAYYISGYNLENGVIIPDTSTGEKPPIQEGDYYDWRQRNIPEIFQTKNGRVHAFNPSFDREGMIDFIQKRRHSHLLFGASYENVDFDVPGRDIPLTNTQYADRAFPYLDDLDITNFRIPAAKYDKIEEVIDDYRYNRKCYEKLMDKIRLADDEDELSTLAYIYQEMYTREFDKDFYKLSDGSTANSLVDILIDRDYILYEAYREIMLETNLETRQDQIRQILNDLVETLEYYISGDGLEYLFAFTPIDSFYNIVYYIWLMANFFKSYKVQFVDPYATMIVDDKLDPLDARVWSMDRFNEYKTTYWKWDKPFTVDNAVIEPEYRFKDHQNVKVEALDYYAYEDDDPFADKDYDGLDAPQGENLGFKDLNGGVADDKLNAPYFDVNCGKSYLSLKNINDLNGGEAYEGYKEYADVDGGEAYHPDDERTDWYGIQGFNYDLDGGACTPDYFNSRALDVHVDGNEVSMNVLVSRKKNNHIVILDDGVYIPDRLADQYEFDTLAYDTNAMVQAIAESGALSLADLANIDSFEDVQNKIAMLKDMILYNMKSAYYDVTQDLLFLRIKALVDSQAKFIYDRYVDKNPYGWIELGGTSK